MSTKWRTLLLLALAEFLAMSPWFSTAATTPALIRDWGLTSGGAAALTMAVQLGFVFGALISAILNLADIWPARRVLAAGALTAAGLNALIPLVGPGLGPALALRFGTGVCLAAVYPPGMKIMATWTKEDRGVGLGLLVGALTVGSASPHLVKGLGGIESWQPVFYTVSALAATGGVLAWFFGELGPYRAPAPRFQWRFMSHSLTDRALRLANFGYLGHMWELYAMWTWIPLFLLEAYRRNLPPGAETLGPERLAAFAGFAVIALGGPASLLAGRVADRWGRSRVTIVSMAISGACALLIGAWIDSSWLVCTTIALLWGFAVVADSAQFSTAISELGQSDYMGTLLTTQTCMGFLLTLVSIWLVPLAVDLVGWTWGFAFLAVGPAAGIEAMRRLKRSPEARRLAGGRG